MDIHRSQTRRKEEVPSPGTISVNSLHVGSLYIGLCVVISVRGMPIDPLRG